MIFRTRKYGLTYRKLKEPEEINFIREFAFKSAIMIGIGAIALANSLATAYAFQPDAPFLVAQQRNSAKWAAEDATVNDKLAALEQKFGKKPNIIYILGDDVGWGELGWQGGGKFRGTPTPTLDKLANEGMKFWAAYAEPSCTPSRIAINTGRHPVRTGVNSVLWPGQTLGLPPEEVTIAEVLSGAGYRTAMWGKWHVGELPEQAPENQGYDYAYYGQYNGAPAVWQDADEAYQGDKHIAGTPYFYDYPGDEDYKKLYGLEINPGYFVGRKGETRKPLDIKFDQKGMVEFEENSAQQIVDFIKGNSKGENPFFIYWATYTQQLVASPKYNDRKYVDDRNPQASFMAMHNEHVESILNTLEEEGIAENTLIVWFSDNGPMTYFWPNAGYTWLRGQKGSTLEGGVRVPAMAWWPGMIKPGQEPMDILHLTDLFTTAARIGGALDNIPSDRVTDGIDQTALFLLGEGSGRRNYIFHYSGTELESIRLNDMKIVGASKGLFGSQVYNVRRDPREEHAMKGMMYMITPFQTITQGHMSMIKKFPHRDLGFKPTEVLRKFFDVD